MVVRRQPLEKIFGSSPSWRPSAAASSAGMGGIPKQSLSSHDSTGISELILLDQGEVGGY